MLFIDRVTRFLDDRGDGALLEEPRQRAMVGDAVLSWVDQAEVGVSARETCCGRAF